MKTVIRQMLRLQPSQAVLPHAVDLQSILLASVKSLVCLVQHASPRNIRTKWSLVETKLGIAPMLVRSVLVSPTNARLSQSGLVLTLSNWLRCCVQFIVDI